MHGVKTWDETWDETCPEFRRTGYFQLAVIGAITSQIINGIAYDCLNEPAS